MRHLLLVAALVLATPAAATTYHVRFGGKDNLAGTSYATAWGTIGKANRATLPGDVVYVYNGHPFGWDAFPAPDSAGSNPTGGGFITFIGTFRSGSVERDCLTDSTARRALTLPNATITTSYLSLKGFRIPRDLKIATPAKFDSLTYLSVAGSLEMDRLRGVVVDQCTFDGDHILIAGASADTLADCLVSNSRFGLLGRGVRSAKRLIDVTAADSLTMHRNRYHLTFERGADASVGFYGMKRSTWRYSHFTFDVEQETIPYTFLLADKSHGNAFRVDTMLHAGSKPARFALEVPGSFPKTCRQNTLDSSVVVMPAGEGVKSFDRADRWTISNSVIVAAAAALDIGDPRGVTIEHNTFVSAARNGVVWLACCGNTFSGDTTKFYSNLVYSTRPGGQDVTSLTSGLRIGTDSTGTNLFKSNWNAYSVYPHKDALGDRAIIHFANQHRFSAPGDGSAWEATHPPSLRGNADSLSVFGPAVLDRGGPDSTASAALDARIGHSSIARGKGKGGTDAGAIAYVEQGRMSISPGSLSFGEVAVGQTDSLSVTFGNSGDDSLRVDLSETDGELSLGATHLSIASLGSASVKVYYAPENPTPHQHNITITSDDPSRPSATVRVYMNFAASGGGSGESSEEGLRRP